MEIAVLKLVLLFVVLCCIAYGVLFLFPEKIRLMKRHGFHLANADFIKMAKEGNPDARRLAKRSKIVLVTFIASGLLLLILGRIFKG